MKIGGKVKRTIGGTIYEGTIVNFIDTAAIVEFDTLGTLTCPIEEIELIGQLNYKDAEPGEWSKDEKGKWCVPIGITVEALVSHVNSHEGQYVMHNFKKEGNTWIDK